jgi:hypothetical protein
MAPELAVATARSGSGKQSRRWGRRRAAKLRSLAGFKCWARPFPTVRRAPSGSRCFTHTYLDSGLAAARESEVRWMRGDAPKTSRPRLLMKDNRAGRDTPAVDKLLAAGAVLREIMPRARPAQTHMQCELRAPRRPSSRI